MHVVPSAPGERSGTLSTVESLPSSSPQTPLDADRHFAHEAMNQPIVQSALYSQNYSLPADTDCIDHLSQQAGISYTNGGVPESPRRDTELHHQPSTLSRHLGHRSTTNDPAFHPPPEQSSGSISTSPSSNNSSAAYSFTGSQRTSYSSPLSLSNIHNPLVHAQALPANSSTTFHLPTTFGGMQTRSAEHTSSFLPSQRSGFSSSNPVSPNGATSARDRYQNLSGGGKYFPAATAGAQNDYLGRSYLYTSEPNRLLPSSNLTMSSSAGNFASPATQGLETPPFSSQETFYELYSGASQSEVVKPHIEAKIEKGFFLSSDSCWTCYRRNYFAVQCSYTLTPHLSNQPHVLMYNGEQKQVQAMAMALSARVDGTGGKVIELVQHTPKRDKGPQNSIKITKLCPTPPGGKLGHLPHADPHPHYGMFGIGSSGHIPAPYFPLQSQPDPDMQQSDPSNPHSNMPTTPTAHQHTFERIQFKSATANNGKRRAQQQYYHLIVELYADIRRPDSPQPKWVKIAERASSQVVVRGRSPSHYSNEGPNSASSRGAGAGTGGPGGYSHLGNMGYGMNLGGNRSLGGGYPNSLSGYRGNQYAMEPTPMHSHSVSSASSVVGGPVDTFGMENQSSLMLSSQATSDFMQTPTTGLSGLGLPPIYSNGHGKLEEKSYYIPNRIPQLEVGAHTTVY
ncbi:hypothetical protein, variant [Verruconis gallopava]|uniref:NDT80 domain-containing protein n=1 Tax=Verruconis gallopava TaxID=253628 RepID=A0A0D2AHB0_9PEZI|nr:uncharacterized protein PV09_03131 [Verruconis gallopava]XP_016215810.1 hypothetical protein, variant [Verruconis gallopava]KIW05940.1 hypothetical protein PV09_03131 [Verruconis gallopava]KIW05941.1 hypothetical protein, variant [Verruconis gallopava]